MKLYYFETPNGRKACAVAKHVGLPVDLVRIDLSKGEQKQPGYLAVNPNGRVPALEDDGFRLWEAHAIMCYLAQKAGSDLWPKDDIKRIDIIRWLNWDTAHFSRHGGRLFFERFVKPHFGLGDPDAREVDDATDYFKEFAGVLNDHLKGRDFLVGNTLSVADFGVATLLPTAREAGLPLDGFDEIKRWHASLMELPAWSKPFPN